MIVWKQDRGRIISAGRRMIRKDPRMRLVGQKNGVSLVIQGVAPQDGGEDCFLTLVRTVEVLLMAKIMACTFPNNVQLLALFCVQELRT